MKETTVKLSGVAKDRFIERLFAAENSLDPAVRAELIQRTKTVFTSVRVRKAALRRVTLETIPSTERSAVEPATAATSTRPTVAAFASEPTAASPSIATAPVEAAPVPVKVTSPQTDTGPSATTAEIQSASETTFDPYAIGLVPVFQREGRDGLISKLAVVGNAGHLRQMAKAQQIVLPQPLRTGDATPDAIRDAIADAVAKRIADRKAAAR